MRRLLGVSIYAVLTGITAFPLAAAQAAPNQPQTKPSGESAPIYRVEVVARTVQAVSYRYQSGWTRLDFKGTTLAPEAKGEIRVNSRKGYLDIETKVEKLKPASQYGREYLTYVLWAITPDGRPKNLGEFLLDGDKGELKVTTDLQAFGLIVTAEPYFAVHQPSDVVVMENIVRKDTVGKIEQISAKYELIQRGEYVANASPGQMQPITLDKKVPLELYQARNAIQILRVAKGEQYGGKAFQDATGLLNQAEQYQSRKSGKKPVTMTAREAVQKAEDARLISLRRQEEEALANERQAAADREAAIKAKAAAAAAEAARRQQLEAEKRAQADRDRLAAEKAKAEADAARALSAEAAEQSRLAAQKAEADRVALRQSLIQQFNSILETRETSRGLVINMADVLFSTGSYALKPDLREKLARLSGIIISHPGLNLEVEGHTDSVGSDQVNQKLSEQRAGTVKDYLLSQGVKPESITSKGFGKYQPIASNDTAAGKKMNRRVEMIVSGEVIGVKIGMPPAIPATASTPAPPAR